MKFKTQKILNPSLDRADKEGNHHFQERGNPQPFILRK